ncbi:MAG: DUF502 domain-containing protein [Campylobacterota bacterium]|nr:DUF502 domain-containing protein [Campylobacterota bacterium]
MIALWKKLLRYIFVGGLSLLPLVFVLIVVNFLKNIGVSAYFKLNNYTDSFGVTLILVVVVLVLFAVIGYSLERYGKSLIISVLDRVFEYIPAIRTVYSVSKKVANMFSGRDENGKKEVVLVEYPKDDVWVPAYVLNRYEGVNVLFVPTSPNPTSGYTVLVKDALVIRTSLTLEEASAFIISMGADFAKKEEIVQKISDS